MLQAYEKCENIEFIITRLETMHRPISKYFYLGIGLRLQSVDSEMALEIVSYFTNKGIVVLPIHDSFIVQSKYENELILKMKEVYSRYNNGFTCAVKWFIMSIEAVKTLRNLVNIGKDIFKHSLESICKRVQMLSFYFEKFSIRHFIDASV